MQQEILNIFGCGRKNKYLYQKFPATPTILTSQLQQVYLTYHIQGWVKVVLDQLWMASVYII